MIRVFPNKNTKQKKCVNKAIFFVVNSADDEGIVRGHYPTLIEALSEHYGDKNDKIMKAKSPVDIERKFLYWWNHKDKCWQNEPVQ